MGFLSCIDCFGPVKAWARRMGRQRGFGVLGAASGRRVPERVTFGKGSVWKWDREAEEGCWRPTESA